MFATGENNIVTTRLEIGIQLTSCPNIVRDMRASRRGFAAHRSPPCPTASWNETLSSARSSSQTVCSEILPLQGHRIGVRTH